MHRKHYTPVNVKQVKYEYSINTSLINPHTTAQYVEDILSVTDNTVADRRREV